MAKSTISTGPFSIANCWFTRGYISTFFQSLSQSLAYIIPHFPINILTLSQPLSHWIDYKIPLNHYKSHSNPISTGQSGTQKARAPLTRRHRHIERHRAGLQTCVLKGVTWVFVWSVGGNKTIEKTHRIHGDAIYANIWGILMVNVTIYSSTMDPMGDGFRIF